MDGIKIGVRYVQLAERAVSVGTAGSSAAGEFPKFTAQRALAGSATSIVCADNAEVLERLRSRA